MNKNFVMLSGLPRSGSQVLSSMLNQHPEIYASTTSPVADLIGLIGEQWPSISQALVDPDPKQYSKNELSITLTEILVNEDYQINYSKMVIVPYNSLLEGMETVKALKKE